MAHAAHNSAYQQPWIYKAWVDMVFVVGPAFGVTLFVLLLPGYFEDSAEMPPQVWLLLIVGVDVAHVYSTLWRTYLDPVALQKHRNLLRYTPLLVWVGGMMLYAMGALVFWRVLAYLAVFHFIRQQYGLMSVYARQDARPNWEKRLDEWTVYALTGYPILYWHAHLPRNFNWFVASDFVALPWPILLQVGMVVYALLISVYVLKELWRFQQLRRFNWPKNLILLGTGLSWYSGIVLHNGDLAFTATNVIAHGLPYMAMVWIYGRKAQLVSDSSPQPNFWMKWGFRAAFLPVFVGLLLALAYLEEGLWDGLVWRDHASLFPWARQLPQVLDHSLLAILVPLLSLPQVTHYIVDGFIWKSKKGRG